MQKAKTIPPCQSFPSRRDHLVRSQSLGGISEGHSNAPALSQCLNWPLPTLSSIYSLKDFWGRGNRVSSHNTGHHKVDIYESAKKFIMFFQTIKNTNWKPPCSCGNKYNRNTKWSQTVRLPSKKSRKYSLEMAPVLVASQEGWSLCDFLWTGINPSPPGQEGCLKFWLSWHNSGDQRTLPLWPSLQ